MTEDTKLEPTWLDRSPGSGSLTWAEAKRDETARSYTHDGRAVTRTTFYQDVDIGPEKIRGSWENFAALNDDMYHPDRGKQNHAADRRRIVEILCGELECTEHQRDRVHWTLDQIGNIQEFFPTAQTEPIVLAVISLVVDEETTDFSNRISARDEFKNLLDAFEMDYSRLWSIRKKIRVETDLFDDHQGRGTVPRSP